MDIPSHPERDDDHGSATGLNWTTVLVVAVVFALVATVVILHLSGVVGPAGE